MNDTFKEKNMNTRAAFLKKMSLALVSVVGFGLAGINFQKFRKNLGFNIKTLSNHEANELIRNMPSTEPQRLKPKPPPTMRNAPGR